MIRQGASPDEIGDLLRHQSPNTTAFYAKVGLPALRPLALLWPCAARLSIVRGFARYRSGDDLATEIPLPGLLPYRPMRARPYLYSEGEIRQLLKAARNMPSTYSLKPWTYRCLFGLLAVTGVRISEALNLQANDADWCEGCSRSNGTKFGKSRLVPLHTSTRKVLLAYAKRRDRYFEGELVSHFFVSSRGTRLDGGQVRRPFYSLSRHVGLRDAAASHGPRLARLSPACRLPDYADSNITSRLWRGSGCVLTQHNQRPSRKANSLSSGRYRVGLMMSNVRTPIAPDAEQRDPEETIGRRVGDGGR